MDLNQEIKEVLLLEPTKSIWRNNHGSKEFKRAVKIGSLVGNPINKSKNCGCIEDLFIVLRLMSRDKIKFKQIQMENKFKLKEGQLVTFAGSHITNANLTDERAISLLKDRPIRISMFSEYPKDWKELTGSKPERTPREKELYAKNKKEQLEMCEELVSNDDSLKMPSKKSKEADRVSFIIANELN